MAVVPHGAAALGRAYAARTSQQAGDALRADSAFRRPCSGGSADDVLGEVCEAVRRGQTRATIAALDSPAHRQHRCLLLPGGALTRVIGDHLAYGTELDDRERPARGFRAGWSVARCPRSRRGAGGARASRRR